ncbi:tRNA preQ1(34) S-adenosylmethionine ribosyltransferase-isomerase QueA [Salinisphaera sp.]|uniref:tRNA preQ1(34) S-adenosylmethionine ribosyltransferase-isomerase QueA n=1 Tax=Salinisphaera sp. TaxID=1914330 RepID=UPI002D7A2FCB|nr:tRNA preQ1(34) S-adenosylmethionine ribosyltransferase-isomerase QueA [Salinisphaera sp.]HET7313487.1 tRNA preQ1(34) S-adenosylmethionine ribosyltransferase-isomerase QueA [Salinisphaera sp.]
MDKRDFDYVLPEGSIAQTPLAERRASRLLVLKRAGGHRDDRRVVDLPELLGPNDLLVFNDTRVLAARMPGRKASGGAVEVMLERILDGARLTAKIRANKPPRVGSEIRIGDFRLTVAARHGELYTLTLADQASVHDLLDGHGHVPLPPYIRRPDETADRERYQTIWARHDGAVAAPTAGLHFDRVLLAALAERGVNFGYVTLHVGSGTYQRLREGDVRDQTLHAERLQVGRRLCDQAAAARAAGGRVIAVGTTAVRSLETAARANNDRLAPYAGETQLFLKPGDAFYAVDAIFTNFHEPQSSLLMLVSAFAGRDNILRAYAHAVDANYRFLSYGDAMFIG